MDNHHANLTLDSNGYLMGAYSLSPLPKYVRNGLFAISTFGLLSLTSTTLLLLLLLYRLFFSPASKNSHLRYNQALILLFNLLLADFVQALAFSMNFHWAVNNAILAPSMACTTQGWFLLIGDLSSGLFSLAIAAQTFATVVYRWQPSYRVFVMGVVGLWGFIMAMSMTGPLMHHRREEYFFTRARVWCWVREEYESERLYLHYLWIFICEVGSLALYFVLFSNLRRTVSNTSPLARIARFMLLYPIAYTILTLPLASGRMATSAGDGLSLMFFCVAGALMASCGWVDVLLYTCTRRMIILAPSSNVNNKNTAKPNTVQLRYGTVTTIVNLKEMGGEDRWRSGGGVCDAGSCENIVRLDQVVEVTVEDVDIDDETNSSETGCAAKGKRLHDGQHPWINNSIDTHQSQISPNRLHRPSGHGGRMGRQRSETSIDTRGLLK